MSRESGDRPPPERYPANNFALGASAMLGLVLLISVFYVTGVIKP